VACVSEVGQLMVVDHDGAFVGTVSRADLCRAVI
jgi:predicted transcriptional regulator